MKKVLLSFLLVAICVVMTCAQKVNYAKVDLRTELTSVVCYLADSQEVNTIQYQPYVDDVNAAFSSFRNHPVCSYISHLYTSGVAKYSELMHIALAIDVDMDKIKVNTTADMDAIVPRMTKKQVEEYIRLLSDFYKQSYFSNFFQSHAQLYEDAEKVFKSEVIERLDWEVLESWLGDSVNETKLYISMLSGTNCYAYPSSNAVIIGGITTEEQIGRQAEHRMAVGGGIYPPYLTICQLAAIRIAPIMKSFGVRIDNASATLRDVSKSKCGDCPIPAVDNLFVEDMTHIFALLYFEQAKADSEDSEHFDFDICREFYMRMDIKTGFYWQQELWDYLQTIISSDKMSMSFEILLPKLAEKYVEIANNTEI